MSDSLWADAEMMAQEEKEAQRQTDRCNYCGQEDYEQNIVDDGCGAGICKKCLFQRFKSDIDDVYEGD